MAIEAIWIIPLFMVRARLLYVQTLSVSFTAEVSFAVIGGWSTLALSGRWHPEPSWIDAAGRVTGVIWLASSLFLWAALFLG